MPIGGFALLLLGLIVYVTVVGELRLPFGDGVVFAFGKEEQNEASANVRTLPEGTVGVFACPRKLPAFTKITRDHLLTADGFHTVPVVESAIEANGLFATDVDGLKRLLGRVLRREKPVNFAFSEGDFLPVGTKAGPSAGIPPGMRGVWIDVATVPGLASASAGDRIDLVAASQAADRPPADPGLLGNVADPVMRARVQMLATQPRTGGDTRSWVVARHALVVQSMRPRPSSVAPKPAAANSKGVEEVFVAMQPQEVAKFSQAMAEGATLVVAPRSGQPENEAVDEIEDVVPPDPSAALRELLVGSSGTPASLGVVEVIRGESRASVTVPRGQGGR